MVATEYSISNFDYSKALSGALCVITDGSTNPVSSDDSDHFKGAGIVKKDNPNRLVMVVDGTSYYFKDDGTGINTDTGFNLKMGTITDPNIDGLLVKDVAVPPQPATRSGNDSTIIDTLNPRDQFAIQALKIIMQNISDPSILTSAEMDNYCKAAYLWSANMLKNAAKVRNSIQDNIAPVASEVKISSLDNNTEKLLNNLIIELSKTNTASNIGVWAKTGQANVEGEYTNAVAATLPNSGTAYTSVADAEADGWSWAADAERVGIQSMPDLSGTINIGASGLGRDASHPINELVHIGDVNGKGEAYGRPFYVSGSSGTNHDTINVASTAAVSGAVTVSNTSGSNLNIKSASGESVTIKGNSTYSDMNDVLRVNVVAGGGGGGSTDTVHIGSNTNGRGESSSYPFVVKGGDSYTPTGGTQIDDVIKVAIVAGGGGGSSVDKGSVPTVQPSLTYTLEHVLVFQYDSYSTSLRKVALGDLGVPVLQTISNGNFPSYSDIKKGYYYKFITTNPTVVDIDLPAAAVPNGDIVNIVIFSFTLSATANFSVTAQNNNDIWYRESNPGATLAAGTYEIDCLADGNRWIIGVTKLVQ